MLGVVVTDVRGLWRNPLLEESRRSIRQGCRLLSKSALAVLLAELGAAPRQSTLNMLAHMRIAETPGSLHPHQLHPVREDGRGESSRAEAGRVQSHHRWDLSPARMLDEPILHGSLQLGCLRSKARAMHVYLVPYTWSYPNGASA